MIDASDFRPPPSGWETFGTHAPLSPVPPLTFSDETDPDDGLPLWERHDDCRCTFPAPTPQDVTGAYRPPPEGWHTFGTHAPLSPVPLLTFSDETGEDGLPLWERHDDCRCEFPTPEGET